MTRDETNGVFLAIVIISVAMMFIGSFLGEYRQKNLIERECETFGTARIKDIELVCQPAP